jgi:hypothetical protein
MSASFRDSAPHPEPFCHCRLHRGESSLREVLALSPASMCFDILKSMAWPQMTDLSTVSPKRRKGGKTHACRDSHAFMHDARKQRRCAHPPTGFSSPKPRSSMQHAASLLEQPIIGKIPSKRMVAKRNTRQAGQIVKALQGQT